MIKNLKYIPRIINNKNNTPLYVIFFVTSRCNMKCAHCFYWDSINSREHLSYEDIVKISESMDDLAFLRMTGGEPFLRKDLVDIIKAFYKNNGLRSLGINTNGFYTDRIMNDVKKLVALKDFHLDICISLDDLQKEHDDNRKIPGAYNKVFETMHLLNEFKKVHTNLSTNINLTVFSANYARLDAVFEKIQEIHPSTVSATLIRGKPMDVGTKGVDINEYMKFYKKIDAYNSKRHSLYGDINFKDKLMSKKISRTYTENKYQGVTCVAADKAAVIYSDGNVNACELIDDKIGNLADYDFNFRKLWHTHKRVDMAQTIKKTKCFCTHECFMTVNLLLEPKNLIKAMID